MRVLRFCTSAVLEGRTHVCPAGIARRPGPAGRGDCSVDGGALEDAGSLQGEVPAAGLYLHGTGEPSLSFRLHVAVSNDT